MATKRNVAAVDANIRIIRLIRTKMALKLVRHRKTRPGQIQLWPMEQKEAAEKEADVDDVMPQMHRTKAMGTTQSLALASSHQAKAEDVEVQARVQVRTYQPTTNFQGQRLGIQTEKDGGVLHLVPQRRRFQGRSREMCEIATLPVVFAI